MEDKDIDEEIQCDNDNCSDNCSDNDTEKPK